jgi:hypothetical protein
VLYAPPPPCTRQHPGLCLAHLEPVCATCCPDCLSAAKAEGRSPQDRLNLYHTAAYGGKGGGRCEHKTRCRLSGVGCPAWLHPGAQAAHDCDHQGEHDRLLTAFTEVQRAGVPGGWVEAYQATGVAEAFDQKGLLSFLGSRGFTRRYENPALAGLVAVECFPSLEAVEGHEKGELARWVSSRGVGKLNVTTGAAGPGAWMSVDLGEDVRVRVMRYCLQHGSANRRNAARHWVLEGSEDGGEWQVLSEHDDDATFTEGEWVEAHEARKEMIIDASSLAI